MTNIIIHGIQIHDCKPVGNTNVRDSLGHFRYRGVFFFFFFFFGLIRNLDIFSLDRNRKTSLLHL